MKTHIVTVGSLTVGLFAMPYVLSPLASALPAGTPTIVVNILIAAFLTLAVVLGHMVF